MNIKYHTLLLLPVFALAACSDKADEPVDADFRVGISTETVDVGGRGNFVYSASNLPASLNLYVEQFGALTMKKPDVQNAYWPLYAGYNNNASGSPVTKKWPAPAINLFAWTTNLNANPQVTFGWGKYNGVDYLNTLYYKPTEYNGCDDIMYGARYNAPRSSEPVDLTMKHLLAKLTFSIKTSRNDLKIQIRQINLDHLYFYGTYTFTPGHTTGEDGDPGAWNVGTDQIVNIGRFLASEPAGKVIINNEAKTAPVPDDVYGGDYEILVLPQDPSTIRSGSEPIMICPNMTVTYTVNNEVLSDEWAIRVPIPADKPAGGWKQNTQYHYIITVDPEPQVDVEILPIDFSVKDYIEAGTLYPPTN